MLAPQTNPARYSDFHPASFYMARAQSVVERIKQGNPHGQAYMGVALSRLRQQVARDLSPSHNALERAHNKLDRVLSVGMANMPPNPDYVILLLEMISQRLDGAPRPDVWQHIGIKPDRGRELLARNAQALDWPIWFTLRTMALYGTFTDIG